MSVELTDLTFCSDQNAINHVQPCSSEAEPQNFQCANFAFQVSGQVRFDVVSVWNPPKIVNECRSAIKNDGVIQKRYKLVMIIS